MEQQGLEVSKSENQYRSSMVLLGEKQAALFLGISPKTLQSWRVRGCQQPIYRKIGRLVKYLQADLEDYIRAQARHSTSETAGQ